MSKLCYILSDQPINGVHYRQYSSLDLAKESAPEHPDAAYIVEYEATVGSPAGYVPTGRNWKLYNRQKGQQ